MALTVEALARIRAVRAGDPLAPAAAWAASARQAFLADPARRYTYADDLALEALAELEAQGDALAGGGEPDLLALADWERLLAGAPYLVSRRLKLRAGAAEDAACAAGAALAMELGSRLASGDALRPAAADLRPGFAQAQARLTGDTYPDLLVAEVCALVDAAGLPGGGSAEDKDRAIRAARCLRGEAHFRATLFFRGASVRVVLSY